MAPKEIPLKRNNKNNPQIKSYTDAIKRGQGNYHVLPSEEGWKVKKIGSGDERIFSTKDEAISQARENASRGSGEIFIHGRNGLIQERRSYGPDPYPAKN